MNFLANENFPLLSIQLLREAGYSVLSIIETTPGARDHDILKQAQEETRIILTFDRDYGEMIYRHKSFAPDGVIYFRFDPLTPEEPAEILLNIIEKGNMPISGRSTVIERSRLRQKKIIKKGDAIHQSDPVEHRDGGAEGIALRPLHLQCYFVSYPGK